ncbi:MAG: questin oxidase family protein [Tissierellia bacterium]|nr:questin oxidase family protein [Tissierellia bacterium]
MKISTIVNQYAKDYSPYMGQFVNHLPMGQYAIYSMTDSIEKTAEYSKNFFKKSSIDPIGDDSRTVDNLEEVLGKRELYASTLKYLDEIIDEDNVEDYISHVLNTFILGMSSGLFHTLIRLSFSVAGYEKDKDYIDEVKRALAYYITAYREGGLFTRRIDGKNIVSEMENLKSHSGIKKLISDMESTGQKMKALYDSEEYMKNGFVVKGTSEEKLNALLNLTVSSFINSQGKGNILILHCITGLQALTVLEKYFKDYENAIDVFTTCMITHLMTLDYLNFSKIKVSDEMTFDSIIAEAIKSTDVHTVKLTYSANELYKIFDREDLKIAARKRIS